MLLILLRCKDQFSENVFSYSQEIVRTDNITTTYSWSILKMFLFILRSLYLLLTLLLSTTKLFWKFS